MRYVYFSITFIVSIVLLADAKSLRARKTLNYHKKQRSGFDPSQSQSFCKIDLKSTNMASKAADEAKAAKDAQSCASEEAGQRVMEQMADKAEQAARAAEAALNGKKQLLEQLETNQNETAVIINVVKLALKNSRLNIKTIARVDAQIKKIMEQMQYLHEEAESNLAKMKEAAKEVKKDLKENQELLLQAVERSCSLKNCFMNAKKDLEQTEIIAQQAESAAREATERVNAVQEALQKIKRLRRKDDKSLREILLRLMKK